MFSHTYTQTYPTPFVYLLIHINIIILVSIQITLIILLVKWKACLKFCMPPWYVKINKLWLCYFTLPMTINCFLIKYINVILAHILGRERCICCLWSFVNLFTFVSKHIDVFWDQIQTQCQLHMLLWKHHMISCLFVALHLHVYITSCSYL